MIKSIFCNKTQNYFIHETLRSFLTRKHCKSPINITIYIFYTTIFQISSEFLYLITFKCILQRKTWFTWQHNLFELELGQKIILYIHSGLI